jgi:hypothetical protein
VVGRRLYDALPNNLDEQHPRIPHACNKRKNKTRHQPVKTSGPTEHQVCPGNEKRDAGKLGLHNPDNQPHQRVTRTRLGVANMRADLHRPGDQRNRKNLNAQHRHRLPWNQCRRAYEKYLEKLQ